MTKEEFMKKVQHQLIVSCQALEGEPLYLEDTTIMPYMALAAKQAGAAAIRTNGVRDVVAIKKMVDLPVIGLLKKKYEGFEQHITVTIAEIEALYEAGSDVIALDCTLRERPDGRTVNEFIAAIKEKYPDILLMADISTLEEAINAEKAGVDFVGTTLSGYTPYSPMIDGPDFELVKAIKKHVKIPLLAEGKIHSPQQAVQMLACGADAVVVGGAITRPLEIATRFVKAIEKTTFDTVK